MTARPAVSAVAEDLYQALGPAATGDDQAWLLLHLVHAVAAPLQIVQDLAGDSTAGPGWSGVMDLDRCPAYALPWLAQFAGVDVLPGLDDASQRLRIAETQGWRRGTPAAIRAAAQQWLTGTKHVDFVERYNGSAYQVRVTVLVSEASDLDQLIRAVSEAIPAGIIAAVDARPGWTFARSFELNPVQTFAQMTVTYPSQTFLQFGGINL